MLLYINILMLVIIVQISYCDACYFAFWRESEEIKGTESIVLGIQ